MARPSDRLIPLFIFTTFTVPEFCGISTALYPLLALLLQTRTAEGAPMAALPDSVATGNQYVDSSTVSRSSRAPFNSYIAPVLQPANLNPDRVENYTEQMLRLELGERGVVSES